MISSSGEKKNAVVILNGISLEKRFFYHNILPVLTKHCNVEVYETLSKNDAVPLASKAAEKYVDLVFAAGGDGTLNQVVNGILTGRENVSKLPVIGVIPLGSGNDFAKTAQIKKGDVAYLEKLITQFTPKKIDVGRIRYTPFPKGNNEGPTHERFFVNVADIGMGPVVVDKVSKSGRPFGHELAYYFSILSTFATYKPMYVKATTDDWTWEGKLRTLAVGNGKCYGSGLCIAPDAIMDDRIFNVFICGNVSVLDFIRHSSTLKKGKHVRIPEIHYKETTSITLTADGPCMIEGDGEILGLLPAKIELIEKRLEFLI